MFRLIYGHLQDDCSEYYTEVFKPLRSSTTYYQNMSFYNNTMSTFVCGSLNFGGCRTLGAVFVPDVLIHEVAEEGTASAFRADFAQSATRCEICFVSSISLPEQWVQFVAT